MKKIVLTSVIALALVACGDKPADTAATAPAPAPTAPAPAPAPDPVAEFGSRLDQALAGQHRSAENSARDKYRHPKETLGFFGVKGGMTVIEITPGGGWYTEVLAPALRDNGKLIAALTQASTAEREGTQKYLDRSNTAFRELIAKNPALYDQVLVTEFSIPEPNLGAPGSADMVLTFRNVHNFAMWKSDEAMFRAMFDVLKPGGVLGVVDHRAKPGSKAATDMDSGYLTEDYVIKLATDAGFRLDAKSEVNANPNDTTDHPEGVWTLPPSLALKDQDRDKYLAIGESDRMTLRFVKPEVASATPPPAAEGEQVDSFEPGDKPAEAAAPEAPKPAGG